MLESAYQRKVIKRMEGKGYFVINLIKTNVTGIPDLLCLKQGEEPFFIEVKGKKTVVSEIQKYRIKQLTKLGFTAIIDRLE